MKTMLKALLNMKMKFFVEEGETAPENDPGREETKSGCHPTVNNLLLTVHCY